MDEGRKLWLMQLADGEPIGAAPEAVAAELAPAETAELAALVRQRALLRSAFPVEEEVPASLRAGVERAFAARQRRAWSLRDLAVPLAASLAAAFLVGIGTVLVTDHRTDAATARMIAAMRQDRELMAAAFATALDRSVSGQSVAWRNPESGRSGKVTPLRTFRGADGRWCREYEEEILAPGGREREIRTACRVGDGWQSSPDAAT